MGVQNCISKIDSKVIAG
jgi:ribonuclease HI